MHLYIQYKPLAEGIGSECQEYSDITGSGLCNIMNIQILQVQVYATSRILRYYRFRFL